MGSAEQKEEELYLFNENTGTMEKRKAKYIPALFKIFDELIVNARDHQVRMMEKIRNQERLRLGKKSDDPNVTLEDTYKPVKYIKVTIDEETNEISVENDGDGVDIEFHDDEKKYVPELIFGDLLTGTNYDDETSTRQKIVGGRNGYGAKLTNIFSDDFWIETACINGKKKYKQHFSENMKVIGTPSITKYSASKPYTKITFKPDFARFKMTSFKDDDTIELYKKRVWDLAGTTSKDILVYLNGTKLETRDFEKYASLYLGKKTEGKKRSYYKTKNDFWEIVLASSDDDKFEQVSFVNGICTIRGGTHVNNVSTIIANKLMLIIKEKNKKNKNCDNLKTQMIKDNLFLIMNSTIVNPAFDTQTKECLTTKSVDFGSKFDIDDEWIEKFCKQSGIADQTMKLLNFKSDKNLKKSDGGKVAKVFDEKLVDAYYAGKARSKETYLVLTEGDSAKTLFMAGLSALSDEDRKKFGVFPLTGKIINPKDKAKKVEENVIFNKLKKIIGLRQDTKSVDDLRYGHVVVLSDADHDGNHIKALIINMFHSYWKKLLQIDGFFLTLATPIVGAKTSKLTKYFYTMNEFESWKKSNKSNCEITYYKGLGTHDSAEAEELFKDMKFIKIVWDESLDNSWINIVKESDDLDNESFMNKSLMIKDTDTIATRATTSTAVDYDIVSQVSSMDTDSLTSTQKKNVSIDNYFNIGIHKNGQDPSDLALELAFNKKLADFRKDWLQKFQTKKLNDDVNYDYLAENERSIFKFINNELIEFSWADCDRSIPHMMDGLKTSQIKTIYASMKKGLNEFIKVPRLTGYVAEHTSYHHGENNLSGTIINMAQNFVGSNNLPFFMTKGQFGSRLENGKDHAASRYILVKINPIMASIFNKKDNPLCNYRIDDDGYKIEPCYYVPELPMVLINGADGIGTGWSTKIPCFNVKDILANIKLYLADPECEFNDMMPYYNGYTGKIELCAGETRKYKVTANYERLSDTEIMINDIPVGKSFNDYKNFIEKMVQEKKLGIVGYEPNMTAKFFKIKLKFSKADVDAFFKAPVKFEKEFKLISLISTKNIHLYNEHNKLVHYKDQYEVLRNYCRVKLEFNTKRKAHLITTLSYEYDKISEKVRFIRLFIDEDSGFFGKIKNQPKKVWYEVLQENYFKLFVPKKTANKEYGEEDEQPNNNSDDENVEENFNKGYAYLVDMQISTLTEEKIKKLEDEQDRINSELDKLRNTTNVKMWSDEIDDIETQYDKYISDWTKEQNAHVTNTKTKKPASKGKTKVSK
jgi:DNA topoisomerase-2